MRDPELLHDRFLVWEVQPLGYSRMRLLVAYAIFVLCMTVFGAAVLCDNVSHEGKTVVHQKKERWRR